MDNESVDNERENLPPVFTPMNDTLFVIQYLKEAIRDHFPDAEVDLEAQKPDMEKIRREGVYVPTMLVVFNRPDDPDCECRECGLREKLESVFSGHVQHEQPNYEGSNVRAAFIVAGRTTRLAHDIADYDPEGATRAAERWWLPLDRLISSKTP